MSGTIDKTQAFLVYNLFHSKIVEKGHVLNMSDDTTIFGHIPLCYSIQAVLTLLFVFIFITQTCIEKGNSTIIFQVCCAALGYSLSVDAEIDHKTLSASLYHWMHDLSVYFIVVNALTMIGIQDAHDTFNIFKEKKRSQKSPGRDLTVNLILVLFSW